MTTGALGAAPDALKGEISSYSRGIYFSKELFISIPLSEKKKKSTEYSPNFGENLIDLFESELCYKWLKRCDLCDGIGIV